MIWWGVLWNSATYIRFCNQESEWTLKSRDLNPLEYELWYVLESKEYAECQQNMKALEQSIVAAVVLISLEMIYYYYYYYYYYTAVKHSSFGPLLDIGPLLDTSFDYIVLLT